MADRSLYLEIVLDDHGAAKKLAVVDAGLRQIGTGANGAEKNLGGFERAMLKASTVGTMLGNALYDIGRRALGTVVSEFKSAVTESNKMQAAFIGLTSVANKFGIASADVTRAAQELANDGLMTVGDAAAGLKNLLASGFGLAEATKLMYGFKDSAAFGRQGSLEYGQAIVSATEGIKNQNSILVDNAGLTKNLSVIMKEAGMSVNDMARISGDATIRGKFLAGLMKELSLFTGDAAKMTQTYQGAVAKLGTQWTLTKASIGDAVTQNQTVITFVNGISEALTGLRGDAEDASNGLAVVISHVVINMVRMAEITLSATEAVYQGVRIMVDFVSLDLKRMAIQWMHTALSMMGTTEKFLGVLALVNSDFERYWKGFMAGRIALESAAKGNDTFLNGVDRAKDVLADMRTKLEATVGQLVEIKGGAPAAGRGLTTFTDDAKAAAKAAKALAESLSESRNAQGQFLMDMDAAFLGSSKSDATKKLREQMFDLMPKGTVGVTALSQALGDRTQLQNMLLGAVIPGKDFARKGNQGFSDSLKGMFDGFGTLISKELGPTILAAFTGGGDVGKSAGGLLGGGFASQLFGEGAKKAVTGALGKTLGGAIGSVIPGLGTLLGGIGGDLVGKLFGKVGGLFGGEGRKVNDLRDQFIAAAGGLHALNVKATEAGTSLDALLKAKTVRDYDTAVQALTGRISEHILEQEKSKRKQEEIDAVFAKYKLSWKDFDGAERTKRLTEEIGKLQDEFRILTDEIGLDGAAAVKAMKDEILDLSLAAVEAGEGIPPAMAPWLKQLASAGLLTDDIAKALLGLKAEAKVSFKDMEAAAERYGIKLDDLGLKYEQLKFTDQANQIIADWKLLVQDGAVPAHVAIREMKDEVQKLVDKALVMGLAFPAEMRPVLQAFVDAGALVDGTGRKLEDLSKFKFEEPLVDAIRALIDKLDELIQKLTNDVPEAIGEVVDAADGIPDNPFENWEIPDVRLPDYKQGPGGDPVEGSYDDLLYRGYTPSEALEILQNGGLYHRGGVVDFKRAHTGLAVDEGLIIAQSGEGILSRRGMRNIGGRDGLHSANYGDGRGAGVTVSIGQITVGGGLSESDVARKVSREVIRSMRQRGVRFN